MTSFATDLGLEYSEDVTTRNIKILLYGPTGSWKTETVARNFPGLLLFDSEGNSDHLVNNPAIPPFARVKTKDVRKLIAGFDAACAGKIAMRDGSPVQTIAIDSVSVFWSVQSEVAAELAEQRAQRRNQPADSALVTLQDWGKAKRPLKKLLTRFSNAPIPYLVLIAREKDLFAGDENNLKKVGVTPDVVKGTEYDMNVIIHTGLEGGKWFGEVTKVQGKLGAIFPLGKRLTKFPAADLFAYAREELKPAEGRMEDDVELATEIAREAEPEPRTKTRLLEIARQHGLDGNDVKAALDSAGIAFDVEKWDAMVAAIKAAANTNGVPA